MKILLADKFEPWGVDQLRGFADQLAYEPDLKADTLNRRISEFEPDILIVRSTKVPESALSSSRRLTLVIRAGSGVDNIDIAAASRLGIMVANCPGANAVAVAELTLGLMIAVDRRIPDNVNDMRNRKWSKSEYSKRALGFKGRSIGIVGSGKIGTEVARRALAFEMNVLYYHLGRTRRLVDFPQARRTELDDLLREADVVSVHVPGGESTQNLIDERRLSLMKANAIFINTSRADVVDEAALIRALKDGRIRGAAVDVFRDEPASDAKTVESPLCELPNLYVTHHIGASTEQAQNAVAEETVRIVSTYRSTGRVLNCVNTQEPTRSSMLVVRFRNKPGGLAHVFSNLAAEEINVEEMDHVVYDGGNAACAHIRISRKPSDGLMEKLRSGHPNVLGAELMNAEG